MRITFVLPFYPWRPVGGGRVVYEYANRLVARGHQVSVVHARRLSRFPPAPVAGISRLLGRKVGQLRDLAFTPRVRWQTVEARVRMLYEPDLLAAHVPEGDAVFATAWETAEYVQEYPRSKGEKFYLIQHYETWAGPKERVDATWRAPLHKVVVARWLYKIGQDLGCDDLRHIPNGIDTAKFRLLNPISGRPRQAAMLFSHLEWKGPADGLEALRIAKERHPDLRCMLFGTPRRPASIPDWIDYFRDPPQEELVSRIYNGSRLFICSSRSEGFALPPAEAMACGCAVVTTDCGGVRDYVGHEVSALVSPPRDPQALAHSIIHLLEDDSLRQRLAVAGHEHIQQFTWDRSANQLEEYIRSCVAA